MDHQVAIMPKPSPRKQGFHLEFRKHRLHHLEMFMKFMVSLKTFRHLLGGYLDNLLTVLGALPRWVRVNFTRQGPNGAQGFSAGARSGVVLESGATGDIFPILGL